jgi:hypothetical protein
MLTKSYESSREFATDFPRMVEAGWVAASTTTLAHGFSHRFLDRFRANKKNRSPEPRIVVVYSRD